MKKLYNLSQALFVILFGLIGTMMLLTHPVIRKKIPKRDRIELAWKQEAELTADPSTGEVPNGRLYEAWKYMQTLLVGYGKAAITGVQWTERGPNNCGGRTRAVCVDLNDPTRKTIWVGGVNGGIWKTTDITAAQPIWTVTNDFFQNLAITYIEQAPANPQVMYFCTGEGNGNIDAARGLGVWKSTNGGNTWTQLTATNNSSFFFCQKVFALGAGDTVFVATTTGLYRSVNGGTAFTRVLGTSTTIAYDIERAANRTLYATVSTGGSNTGVIHKSFDGGTTWTALTLPTYLSEREIEIALAENDTNTVWGLVENGGRIVAIIKTANAGSSWDTTATHPVDADGGVSQGGSVWKDFSRGQAWYDLSIAVDPNNANVCFVGGIDLFKTSNGGSSWQQVSHWYGGFSFQEVHADQHYALFEPGNSNVIYFTNDGGIYRSSNAAASIPVIDSKEYGYNTTQFYACAIHPGAGVNYFLAGAQDNGSHRFNSAGINSTVEVTGGDGAFVHIDQNQPQFQFTSYVYNNYRRSTNSGNSFSSIDFGNTGSFINPTDLDDTLNVFYGNYSTNLYFRWNNPQSGNSWDTIRVNTFNGSVTHVKVSPNNLRRVYFGTSSGRVVRVDSATAPAAAITASQINSGAGMPTGSVSCIEVERGNENHILVTFSNYGVNSVWETRNGGTNWTSVEGNVPDMPVRWALFNPNKPWQALIATELGVWSTDTLRGTTTDWQPSNSGLANVRVTQLHMRTSDKLVIASTHGRGLFSSDIFMNPFADFSSNKRITYINKPIQFSSTSSKATSYLWNFGDGTTSTAANPLKVYSTAGTFSVTLTINGGVSTKTISNFITILPYRGIPYLLANGGNFEVNPTDFAPETVSGTAFVRGNSTTAGKSGVRSASNAWVTGLSGNYADNTTAYLYSPSFNMTASGTYNLSFYAKNIFEIGYDGYLLQYSLNGGDTWTYLGNAVQTNWYDYANTAGGRPFPTGQPFFNATSNSYALRSFNVSSLAGNNNVCFRFVFRSDASVNAAGFAIDDFELTGPTNNALPVSLLSFAAKRISKNEVLINWLTGNELNNKGFDIERSLNFNESFESIGFVSGKGNSKEKQTYQLLDGNNPHALSFYRLKQTDIDGTVVYSDVVVVKSADDIREPNLMQVWPTANEKQFFIHGNFSGSAKLTIFSGNGQLIAQKSITNQDRLSLENVPSGIYFLRVTGPDNSQQTIKLLVP
ncbi:MAG: PKD domain-containing protein [Sphingobacteriales bacterium]|jgi:PKD repeat protein|nr:PKD domain-containing protein [Sphingobacteriales bacterium]